MLTKPGCESRRDRCGLCPARSAPIGGARLPHHMRRRLVVKPGITGLSQVNGRSDLSWADAVRLDLRYVESWSSWASAP